MPPLTPSYLAFVEAPGGIAPTLVDLGSAAEIDALVSRWREEVAVGARSVGPSSAQAAAARRAAGEALRRRIFDPLAKALFSADRVFVVPDGTLYLVNLYALPDAAGGYLIESGPLIHYLSAEKDLVRPETEIATGRGLLTLGGPQYDESVVAAARPGSPASRSACGDFRSMRFEPLPRSMAEIEEINDLWAQAGAGRPGSGDRRASVVTLVGAGATEAAFKAAAPGKRILHLATHGFFLGGECRSDVLGRRGVGGLSLAAGVVPPPSGVENPLLLSGLALAGANRRADAGPGEEDGILTAEEIASMDLSGVEWAVLSACDTGRGEILSGEGVLGLARAFRIAGAGTVIMSLWPVEDQAAREWMRSLYTARLLDKEESAQAVRTASLKLLGGDGTDGPRRDPFYWSGFVATGDWK